MPKLRRLRNSAVTGVNYTTPPIISTQVRRIVNGRRVDFVINKVGSNSIASNMDYIRTEEKLLRWDFLMAPRQRGIWASLCSASWWNHSSNHSLTSKPSALESLWAAKKVQWHFSEVKAAFWRHCVPSREKDWALALVGSRIRIWRGERCFRPHDYKASRWEDYRLQRRY